MSGERRLREGKVQPIKRTEIGPMSAKQARAVQNLISSERFAETMFDPEEVSLADLSSMVDESELLTGEDEVAVSVVAATGYVFILP